MRALPDWFDALASLLLADQLPERALIVIHEFVRLEVPGIRPYDRDRQIKHVLRDFLIRNIAEIGFLVADLVGVAERES